MFTSIGQLELFYDQAPDVMRSCSMALVLLSVCIGSYLSGGHSLGGRWLGAGQMGSAPCLAPVALSVCLRFYLVVYSRTEPSCTLQHQRRPASWPLAMATRHPACLPPSLLNPFNSSQPRMPAIVDPLLPGALVYAVTVITRRMDPLGEGWLPKDLNHVSSVAGANMPHACKPCVLLGLARGLDRTTAMQACGRPG